jgi:hypothetical protein
VKLALCFVALTLSWGIVGLPWLFQPAVTNFSGIGSDTDVERIHARFPNFLVDPATLENTGEDVWSAWFIAEVYTRLAIVAGSWILVAAMLWLLDWHSRKTEVRRITNWTPR